MTRSSMNFVAAALCLLGAATANAQSRGVVDEPPRVGRSVPVAGGHMVAYEAVIPGSETRFWMEPIPGGVVALTDPETGEPVQVTVAPCWIGRTEVTWGEYRRYMALCTAFDRFNDAGMRQLTDENRVDAVTAPSKLYDPSFTFDSGEEANLPAVSMTQYAAKQYTKWLSLVSGEFYRLPSEAEWTHACLAGEAEATATDANAWHEENADFATHPVGRKTPNARGLFDMLGNASEWTLDAHDGGPLVDPDGAGPEPPVRWPTTVFPRVLKGGSAFLGLEDATAQARRASDDATWKEYDPNTPKSPWWFAHDEAQDVGFRVVRPYRPPARQRREVYWQAEVARTQRVADFRIDEEGRGERGLVDPTLPAAIKSLEQ